MSDYMRVTLAIAGALLAFGFAICMLLVVLMFYGAVFGAIGAGAYGAFKFLVGLLT